MIGERLVRALVERAGIRIALEFGIPLGRVERGKPLPKSDTLFGSEFFDLTFKLFELCHIANIAVPVSIG